MPRYIDADALVKVFERYDDYAIDIVNDQHTADVVERKDLDTITEEHEKIGYEKGYRDGYAQAKVEVVRCKDCIHHINAPKTTGVWCEMVDGLLQKDWFCADGERRGNEESTKRTD